MLTESDDASDREKVMSRAKQPLAEVFGYPPDNLTENARRFRENCLCPFNNIVPNCTKSRVDNPLGVCSIQADANPVIICPVRFRQGWRVASDAAKFFFPRSTRWTSLTEVRLADKHGGSAGNIDVVLVSYDAQGRVTGYGALEVQAVYISGNITNPFQYYMDDPEKRHAMDWSGNAKYPRPDYLSSSRKRLAPQLIYKGGILHAWQRKTAVALNKTFFATLPSLEEVSEQEGEMAWFIYDLKHDAGENRYHLVLDDVRYTKFQTALQRITHAEPGDEADFIAHLQVQLDDKIANKMPAEVGTIDFPGK